jgi:hypothetical protein
MGLVRSALAPVASFAPNRGFTISSVFIAKGVDWRRNWFDRAMWDCDCRDHFHS